MIRFLKEGGDKAEKQRTYIDSEVTTNKANDKSSLNCEVSQSLSLAAGLSGSP